MTEEVAGVRMVVIGQERAVDSSFDDDQLADGWAGGRGQKVLD